MPVDPFSSAVELAAAVRARRAVGSLTQSKGGLPIGVQLVGRRWSEPKLLALAQKVALITGPFAPPPAFKS